jgi:hypothetical protein
MKGASMSDILKNSVKNYRLCLFLVVISFCWTDCETVKVKQAYEDLM